MSFRLISQYRNSLMGFAILWIIVYHFYLVIQPIDQSVFPVRIGYGGVDIFLLLSGLGLYYSYTVGGGIFKEVLLQETYSSFTCVLDSCNSI